MNCREAHTQIFAERDGALAEGQRAALVSHVATCGDCRRMREDLAAAITAWRSDAAKIVVPDAEREWHAVRRKIRGGAEGGEIRLTPRRPGLLAWITMPLAAVGALALALFISLPPTGNVPPAAANNSGAVPVARLDSVEVPGGNTSTVISVDDKSGWLIVWASDAAPKRG